MKSTSKQVALVYTHNKRIKELGKTRTDLHSMFIFILIHFFICIFFVIIIFCTLRYEVAASGVVEAALQGGP